MPKWGIEMTEGTIAEWMVAEGKAFAKGDVLTLIETDKITNEVEAEAEGSFVRIVAQRAKRIRSGRCWRCSGTTSRQRRSMASSPPSDRPIRAWRQAIRKT